MITNLSQNLVVLGANSDIGKILVQRAGAIQSFRVLAVSRSKKRPKASDSPAIVRLGGIDLTSEIALRKLAIFVKGEFKAPFTIVHCAGNFWIHKPLLKTSFSEIKKMIDSQLLTLVVATRVLTPLMIKNGGGRLVAFSCNSVNYNYPDMSPFTASKAAIESFVKCYANEYAEFGVSACALALPTIRTAKVLKIKRQGDHKNYIKPEDLADFILNHIMVQPHEVNGNIVKVFKHSHSFYHKSFYARNPLQKAWQISRKKQ